MRILLSKSSKKLLFDFLKRKYECNSLKKLSSKLNISFKTLNEWAYNPQRYLPEKIILGEIRDNLNILDSQKENWGRIKGGKKTYKILIQKYGPEEIKRRQSNGGKKSTLSNRIKRKEEPLVIDLKNPLFLELYGALLGDGWLSKLNYKGKISYIIGVSGNRKLDQEYFLYLKNIFKVLLGRDVYIKDRPKSNSIEIYFSHKSFLCFLHNELNFPIGQKINLEINPKIYSIGFEEVRYVIKGIFDTDGCFVFDKTPAGNPYPVISIKMKAPRLIKQIYSILVSNGFKVYLHEGDQSSIFLKGSKQLNKWMHEIGSSNKRNLDKVNKFMKLKLSKQNALVAQLDSAAAS